MSEPARKAAEPRKDLSVPAPIFGPGDRTALTDRARLVCVVSFVCPGLGQLLAGRWAIGLIQLILFLTSSGVATAVAVAQIVHSYRTAFQLFHEPAVRPTGPRPGMLYVLFACLIVAVGTWLWSLLDAGKQPARDRMP